MRLIYAFLVAITCGVAVQATEPPAEVPPVSPAADYDIGPDRASEVENPTVVAKTLIVYSARWCVPCQMMKPTLLQLKREGYKIVVLDVDKVARGEQEDKYKVKKTRMVPEIVWYGDGKVAKRATGYQTRVQILRTLKHPKGEPDGRTPVVRFVDRVRDRLSPDNR